MSVTHTPTLTPVQASAPDIARRFALIVAGLAALVARRFLRDPKFQSLIVPLWTRITRAGRRFERLMARVAANRLRKPRPARPHHTAPATARPPALPAGHGWLIRAIPYEAAAYASQLEALLAEPGSVELLAACPAAGRLLRPLGRMLGISALAPRRIRPKRPPAAPRPPRPTVKFRQPDETYRPSAKWPRGPWPTHRPRATWPPACRSRANPA